MPAPAGGWPAWVRKLAGQGGERAAVQLDAVAALLERRP